MKVVKVKRRSQVLKNPAFGCLKDIPSVNVTRGCLHRCAYCYARVFPETPKNEVQLYENLPEKLEKEIVSRLKRGRKPKAVAFSTASDAFQPNEAILQISFECMKILLKSGVAVSFLTKGRIPEKFFSLFNEHKGLVKPRFGLVSLSSDYRLIFEPRTAPPYLRLRLIEKAAKLGLEPAVRIDPVIPGLTDREEMVESLMRRLAMAGVKEVSVSYLVLRPKVMEQMEKELPYAFWQKIFSVYQGEPWCQVITSATTKLVRKEIREKGYALFKEIGRAFGLTVKICGCKNPDLPFEFCAPWEIKEKMPKQKELFK
ncbi:radical SAM protein [Thermodesulfatator indicus]